jgi:hypothetical protein
MLRSRLQKLGVVIKCLDRMLAGKAAADQAHQQLLALAQRHVCQIILVALQESEHE